MRVVLLGAGGLLARDIRAHHPRQHDLAAFTRSKLDVRDTTALEGALREVRPNWVINASAYADVDGAERDSDTAFAVNAVAVGELARLCAAHDSGLVHFSTDYVFDGTTADCYREDDEPRPVNAYGASKLAGEDLVRRSGARHLIVRTQWLYGVDGAAFLSTLWRRAKNRLPTRVVADQFGCCTYTADLARVTWDALGRLEGTYHVANRGRVSRFDFARKVFESAGAAELVVPCKGADVPAPARRPANSPMCVERIERALGYAMPEWTDALERYLSVVAREEDAPARAN